MRFRNRFRPSMILLITTAVLSIAITIIPAAAKSTTETKPACRFTDSTRSFGNATTSSNYSHGVASTSSKSVGREHRQNTTGSAISNQTRSDTTKRRKEHKKKKKKKRKRSDVMNTGSYDVRNVPVPSSKKRSVRTSTILRLQREWQKMIKSGVAYDWYNQRPIPKRKASTADDDDNDDDDVQRNRHLTSQIWIGPISKHQWYIWHFTFTCHDIGNENDNPYFHGVYHGRLVLSKDYPLRPPISIQMYTPNGRFLTHQNICFTSITHYHPDEWNTNSHIYSMIESLRYHMVTSKPGNEIGAVSYASHEQKQSCAIQSQSFRKYIPVPYRPSSRTTTSKATTLAPSIANRNAVMIDHGHMIQQGYVTVPQTVVRTSTDDNNTTAASTRTSLHTKQDDTRDRKSLFVSTTTSSRVSIIASKMDGSVAPLKRKKKKTKKKSKQLESPKMMTGSLFGRRPWNLLRRHVYYCQCSVSLLAFVLVWSSSLLHPMLKMCLMLITSMTLLFHTKM